MFCGHLAGVIDYMYLQVYVSACYTGHFDSQLVIYEPLDTPNLQYMAIHSCPTPNSPVALSYATMYACLLT